MNILGKFLVRSSPFFLITKFLLIIYNWIKNKFSGFNKKSPVFKDPEIQDIISPIKETKKSSDEVSFISGFKYPSEKREERKNIPMDITPRNREILNRSIVISPYDTELSHRGDLEFIGNSRITGRGIYRYVGTDFSKFDLPYDEIVSIEQNFNLPVYEDPYRSSVLNNSPEYYSELSEYYSKLHK